MVAAVVVAAVVASHRDAAYVCVCTCTCVSALGRFPSRAQSDTCAVAQKMTVIRVIILILKKKPLSPTGWDCADFRLWRGWLSAPLPDRAARNRMGWIGDRGFFTRAFRRIRWFLLTGTRDPRAITKDRMYSGRRGWCYDKRPEV